jgi:hypothetical protein
MKTILLRVLLLGLASCGGSVARSESDTGAPGKDGGGQDATVDSTGDVVLEAGDAKTDTMADSSDAAVDSYPDGDAGTLVLQAFGGASGEVATEVYVVLDEPVGPQQTCAGPLDGGACQLTSCMQGGIDGPGYPGYGNFGPIYASVGTTTETLTYSGVGYPTVDFPSSVTLGTGGTMKFHGGNGGSVPTFDVSATIPGLAVITSPLPTTDGGSAIIDTSHDLSVTWVPISIGEFDFQLEGGSASPGGTLVFIACTFGGAAGTGVVPQTLLSSMKEMGGSISTYAQGSTQLEATTVVDGLTIVTQSSQNSPTLVNDTFYVTYVTLQ